MKEAISLIVKGAAMGAANVIPGVSGGTIALITGIFERLINAIKSLNIKALKLILKADFKGFAVQTDFFFLVYIFAGVGLAIFSLARVFDFLFNNYPVYIWAYFFGLLLASVYFVGKTISKWSIAVWVSFLVGTFIALIITYLKPANENREFLYLVLSGVVAVCSMILPGLSGSFVLILMGNYKLVAIEAINNLDFSILLPVLLGMVVGLIAFSHLLSWLLKQFKNQTLAVLTGFILGSLGVIWPWKNPVYMLDAAGQPLLKAGKPIVQAYEMAFPGKFGTEEFFAFGLILTGLLTIFAVEYLAQKKNN
jgi:putative membrane protein